MDIIEVIRQGVVGQFDKTSNDIGIAVHIELAIRWMAIPQ